MGWEIILNATHALGSYQLLAEARSEPLINELKM